MRIRKIKVVQPCVWQTNAKIMLLLALILDDVNTEIGMKYIEIGLIFVWCVALKRCKLISTSCMHLRIGYPKLNRVFFFSWKALLLRQIHCWTERGCFGQSICFAMENSTSRSAEAIMSFLNLLHGSSLCCILRPQWGDTEDFPSLSPTSAGLWPTFNKYQIRPAKIQKKRNKKDKEKRADLV